MQKKYIILGISAVLLTAGSFSVKSCVRGQGGVAEVTEESRAAFKRRGEAYAQKMKDRAAQRVRAANPEKPNPAKPDLAKPDTQLETSIPEVMKIQKSAVLATATASVAPSIVNSVASRPDIVATSFLKPVSVVDFKPGSESLYLKLSSGSVVWLRLSSDASEFAKHLSKTLKNACISASVDDSGRRRACTVTIAVDTRMLDSLAKRTSDGSPYFLACRSASKCLSAGTPELIFMSRLDASKMELVGEVKGLIFPVTTSRMRHAERQSRIVANRSVSTYRIEKVFQTSKIGKVTDRLSASRDIR
jgi:hypothetical protein